MRTILTAVAVLCAGSVLEAGDHLVTPDAVHARLVEATDARRAHLAYLAPRVGPLHTVLHRLDDDELRDLAARAAALEADPRATGPGGVMIAVLIVVAVVLLAGMVLELT